jgi:hypothetical protein
MRAEIRNLRGDMKDLRGEMKDLHGEIKEVELEQVRLRGDMERGFAQVHGDIKALRAERGHRDYDDDDDLGGLPTRRVRSREPAVAVQ